jgi:hypothetical protein
MARKYSKKHRAKLIRQALGSMDFYPVVCLCCAIDGISPRDIERQVGEMSTNQWRNYLDLTINRIIEILERDGQSWPAEKKGE